MSDKSAEHRILDTMSGREQIGDDLAVSVRVRDLNDLLREHEREIGARMSSAMQREDELLDRIEAQDKAIREVLNLVGDPGPEARRILSSVLEARSSGPGGP